MAPAGRQGAGEDAGRRGAGWCWASAAPGLLAVRAARRARGPLPATGRALAESKSRDLAPGRRCPR